MSRKQTKNFVGHQMEDVDENYSDEKVAEAKINIVVGTPNITAIESQKINEVEDVKDQTPFELPFENPQIPSQDALHSSRITLKKGIEQKVIEETVNNVLTPHKAGHKINLPVFQRLYAVHEEKMVEKILSNPEILKQYGGPDDTPKKASTSPNVPRVYGLAKIRTAEKLAAQESVVVEAKKNSQPRINEFSRILADSLSATPDRRAFKEGYLIVPREKHNEALSSQHLEKELKECTFHPKINEYPSYSSSPSSASPSTPVASSLSPPSSSSGGGGGGSGGKRELTAVATPAAGAGVNGDGQTEEEGRGEGSGGGDTARTPTQEQGGRQRYLELYNSAKVSEEKKKALREEYEKKELEKCQNYTPVLVAKAENENIIPKDSSFMKRLDRYLERRKEVRSPKKEEEQQNVNKPEVNAGVQIPTVNFETYVNTTWGVKKHLDKEKKTRDMKKEKEKPLFDPNRKYPPPPTLFREFNITSRSSPSKNLIQSLKNYEAE